jgi:hypothetical protein
MDLAFSQRCYEEYTLLAHDAVYSVSEELFASNVRIAE